MRKAVAGWMVAAVFCSIGQSAAAEVPYLVPVLGMLTDADDVPLEGDLSVVFTLYTAETGGVTLWGETQTVTFEDGLFRVYLGSETLGGLDVTDFVDNESVWLGLRVGADGEMNRVRLASVPWAFEAETCGQVTDLSAAGIQGAIGADACGANQAMRGWTGSAAVCVNLPDVSGVLEDSDIGVTVQAPIDQALLPCNYGIQQIGVNGSVVCVNQDVVTQCGEGAGEGSADNYLGSDGACHKAPHSCSAGQYLDGSGNCVSMAVSGTANTLSMFTGPTSVGNSVVTQSGTAVGIAGSLSVPDAAISNISSGSRMHVSTTGGQDIYLLASGQTVVSNNWGGTGNLVVQGTTTINGGLSAGGNTWLANATVGGTLTAGYQRLDCPGTWGVNTCTCPEGTRVVGGGGICFQGFLSQSYPHTDLRTWIAHCHTDYEHAYYSYPTNIYAICARIN